MLSEMTVHMQSAPTSALLTLLFAAAGFLMPSLADGILKRARARYRAWNLQASKAYSEFLSEHEREPAEQSTGDERLLWEWKRETERLASEGLLSRDEAGSIEASGAAILASAFAGSLPEKDELDAKFAFERTLIRQLALAGCLGLFAWRLSTEHGDAPACAVAGTAFLFSCLLMAIVDAKSRTIPLSISLSIAASALSWSAFSQGAVSTAQAIVCAGACWIALRLANASAQSRGRSKPIGGGDVKTLPWVTAAVFSDGLASAACAGCLALGLFLARRAIQGKLDLKETIPLGPFMAVMGAAGLLI